MLMGAREREMAQAIERIEEEDDEESENLVYVRPRPPRSPAQVYSVRIPVARIEELRAAAEGEGKRPADLISAWVIERLQADPGPRRSREA